MVSSTVKGITNAAKNATNLVGPAGASGDDFMDNLGEIWRGAKRRIMSGSIGFREFHALLLPYKTYLLLLRSSLDFTSKVESRLSVNEPQKMSQMTDEEVLKRLSSGGFSLTNLPTAHAVIASCMIDPEDDRIDFVEGQWVERLGHDMVWHLDRVMTIHKIINDDFDWSLLEDGQEAPWTAFYDFHSQKMLNKVKLRHPEEGLKRIFGTNPWIWQQYAVLKVEEQIRFHQNHYNDFDKIDIDRLAKTEWDKFIAHEGNEDLKARLDDERFANANRALVHQFLSPFRVMEGLRNARTDNENAGFNTDWDMSDERLSAYTYLGVLGNGWLVPLLCVFVQFAAPLLLGSYALETSDRNSDNNHDAVWCDNEAAWSSDKIKGKLIMFTIVILYISKIVPDAVFNFIRSVGEGIDAHSKVMALRKLLWDRGEDFNLGQMIGYKLDLYMNTSYVCALYTLNLFILFTTESVVEMMLNAMAVEFVLKMDEEFASTDWWDPDKRWIRAGALELTIGSTLRTSHLSNAVKFEKHYKVSMGDLTKVLGNEPVRGLLFEDRELAEKDSTDTKYLTAEDAVNQRFARIAKENNLNRDLITQFEKPLVHFGVLSRIMHKIAPKAAPNTLFQRYTDLYTWSRWHAIMYGGVAKPPPVESIYDKQTNNHISPNDHHVNLVGEEPVAFQNFDFGQVRGGGGGEGKERRTGGGRAKDGRSEGQEERSDSKSSTPPTCITNNQQPLIAARQQDRKVPLPHNHRRGVLARSCNVPQKREHDKVLV